MRENGVKLPVHRHFRNGPWIHECRLSYCVALLLNQNWDIGMLGILVPSGPGFFPTSVYHTDTCTCDTFICIVHFLYLFNFIFLSLFYHYLLWYFLCFWASVQKPTNNGQIALWPTTRVFNCEYHISQKCKGSNYKNQWYNVLNTFISQFRARLY